MIDNVIQEMLESIARQESFQLHFTALIRLLERAIKSVIVSNIQGMLS